MSRNRLDTETSPYLLQHKDNPVHWHPWGREALSAAKRENKPVLLSIGYAACHWCHVMAHESFEDEATAAVMNELFVNIKVDREERPDIDTIYMTALHMMGEQGGWPLTMFLTPEGEPFFGGTYFPKEPNYGRQGFTHVLKQISRVYHEQPDKVRANAAALKQALAKLGSSPGEAGLELQTLDAIADRLLGAVDQAYGGIGGAPKFPQTGILELLWRAYLRGGKTAYRDAVTLSLDHMCQGGIYDHLGGGFARYAVDERWLAPHFEKMLYDNALIVELLTLVWQDSRNPLYEERIAETIGWVLREMVAGSGAFAASLDADSDGEEGKFYVWNEAEIDAALLPGERPLFKSAYDVSPDGNWEGKVILNRLGALARLPHADEERLASARDALRKARARRVRPGWDDKVLVNWNGLMIRALAKAGAAFGRADWIAAAETAFDGICSGMTDGDRLYHTSRLGRPQHRAMADGYANMADAALALYEITGNAERLERARAWVKTLDTHYWDKNGSGYCFTADDAEALITRTKTAIDDAVPAANGTLVSVLTKLHHLTGDPHYRNRAQALIGAFAGEVHRNFFPLATFLNGFEFSQKPLQIVLAGDREEDTVQSFLAAVHGASLPDRVLCVTARGEALPDGHPASGKGRIAGKPAAYLCVGPQCSAPITVPEDLEKALLALRAPAAPA